MANGMEMMLQSIFRALGIDPEEIKRSMFDTVTKLQTGIQGLDQSLKAIDARLERLEQHLGVHSGAEVSIFDEETGAETVIKKIGRQ